MSSVALTLPSYGKRVILATISVIHCPGYIILYRIFGENSRPLGACTMLGSGPNFRSELSHLRGKFCKGSQLWCNWRAPNQSFALAPERLL
eukprot:6477520-Amphidinium_carterae.1